MFSTSITVKLVLALSFNFLEASANDITATINDIDLRIDEIKNKYFLIRHDIFSPRNSVSTNFDIYSDSLKAISSKLRASRNEIFKKIFDQDIEGNNLNKISKIKLKSELLNNSISVLLYINKYYNTTNKNTLTTFGDYEAQIQRLVSFEKLFFDIK
tara:strand:- start:136 stop:606 length:471 start_codon:yes stop_codon:yes gene_type:complete